MENENNSDNKNYATAILSEWEKQIINDKSENLKFKKQKLRLFVGHLG
jgi:hypothetical protein